VPGRAQVMLGLTEDHLASAAAVGGRNVGIALGMIKDATEHSIRVYVNAALRAWRGWRLPGRMGGRWWMPRVERSRRRSWSWR